MFKTRKPMDFSDEPDSPTSNGIFIFNDFELNPIRGTLTKNGEEIPLRRQCFDVLIHLIRHHGVLVTKQELMEAVWPDVIVTDSSVPQCICTIRRALGDDSKTLIRSMPRSGYLFDAPITYKAIPAGIETGFKQKPQVTGSAGFSGVTPFMSTLAVIAILGLGGTVFEPGENPQAVVTSSFLPETGMKETDDEPVEEADLNALPSTAGNINPKAMQHVELGIFFHGRRAPGDLLLAIDEFRSAVAVDPRLADAWVGLAGALMVQAQLQGSWSPGNHEEYVDALGKALEVDPHNPDANARIASHYHNQGKVALANEHNARAMEFGAENARLLSCAAAQALNEYRFADAAELQRRVVALEPLSFVNQINLAHMLKFAGRLDEAIVAFQTTLDLAHGNEEDAIEGLFRCYFLQGRYDQAEAYAAQLSTGARRFQSFALLGIARNQGQISSEMVDRLSALPGMDPVLRLAEISAFAGDTSGAFHWLEKALGQGLAAVQSSDSDLTIRDMKYSVLVRPITTDDRWLAWQEEVEKRDCMKRENRDSDYCAQQIQIASLDG